MNCTVLKASLRWTLPASLREPRVSAWASANFGSKLGCFLEGPSFDRQGNLLVVDIPFGRIFRVTPAGQWQLLCNYDGWPNGLKVHRDGRILVADYRRGIVQLYPGDDLPDEVATSFNSEGFKGCNDLFLAANGDLWFTDQGQSGLQDPSGRVYCLGSDGILRRVLSNIPSPNGLVMNAEETQLFVAVTRANAVWRLPMMADGSASKVGVFIQLSGGIAGPDGLALDADGGLVVAHPGIGIWRFDRVGRPTHLVESPDNAIWTNIAFGGEGNCELFLVDSLGGSIHCVRMPYAGKVMFSHT